jgi:putative nucleotidyltransferase with HDIG domain
MGSFLRRRLSFLRRRSRSGHWLTYVLAILMVLSIGIVMVGLLSWQVPLGVQTNLAIGEISQYDVVAPRRITYESMLLRARAEERAAQAIPEQYDLTLQQTRRDQVALLRQLISYVDTVRTNTEASLTDKTELLTHFEQMPLAPEVALELVTLSDAEWELARSQTQSALDRALRDEIRENNLALTVRRIPMLLDPDLSSDLTSLISTVAGLFVVPNSVYNSAATQALRDEARDAIPPQYQTIELGQMVVRSGDMVTAEVAEALSQIDSMQSQWDLWELVRAVVALALTRLAPDHGYLPQEFSALVVLVVFWLIAAKFMIVRNEWLPYLYPLAALGMLLGVLIGVRVATVVIVGFAVTIFYMSDSTVELGVYQLLGALAGTLVLGRAERLSAFLWAGLAVFASNVLVQSAFHAPFSALDTRTILERLTVTALQGGLSSAIALIGYFLLGNLFGLTTTLQLNELSRPTHPLLRQLLLKAPGTYHHTILVSNLGERAAAAIGADALLVRVGAYYHDIGKTVRPYFFAENIVDGSSPHERLEPLTSAQIIISHVKDGLDLAQKYRLPPRLRDFIAEHHGQTLVKYFYVQALRQAEEDDLPGEEEFRYPGPSPRTKETAILLLADTCEAAVRAMRPASREELDTLVSRLINDRVTEGELNESNLTFREVQTIRNVFIQVLQGVHHPRVAYPEMSRTGERPSGALQAAASDIGGVGEMTAVTPRSQPGGIEEESLIARAITSASEG